MAEQKKEIVTLSEFIIQRQADFNYAKGELSRILRQIAFAAKLVNREVNKAGLVDILGAVGSTNIQGETVQKLDEFANNKFIEALISGGECAGVASEENDEFIPINTELSANAKYVVMIDPLDGSSNLDVNVSIGTIFAVYRRVTTSGPVTDADFLQAGTKQVAAGYVIYGSSTMLVYTTGNGLNGFTLDPSIGEFCLSHANMKTPSSGKVYSVNQGNFLHFPQGIKDYIKWCQEIDKSTKRPYSLRYIGSAVADFHRNLLTGGIFLYPSTSSAPKGKLRLLYECNPLAFIIEQAGGKATTGTQRILEVMPEQLHQRVPLILGSSEMVDLAVKFYQEHAQKAESV